jgi:uncharacterized protein YbaP (TraB family)
VAARPQPARLPSRARRALLISALGLVISPRPLPAATPRADVGRLWRIARRGHQPSFVLGTIHVPDRRVASVSPPIAAALARSRTLAVELVPETADTHVRELELLDDGERLEDLVGASVYAEVESALSAKGVPQPTIARLKPWAAMMKLGRADPTHPDPPTLDTLLYVAARELGVKILPLELLEEQIAAFDTIPRASQIALLTFAVRHRAELSGTIEPTLRAWQQGDFPALARIAGEPFAADPGMAPHRAALMKNLIDNRTALMHHRLFTPLREGRILVAVGAMHLPGRGGLLALLREDGFAATPIW